MRALTAFQIRAIYIAIGVATLVGFFGYVRIASLVIALGMGAISLTSRSPRRIERYLPLAIAVGLFALALALPRGL